MPLISRQRSRLAVLAVLALVGSLLAVSAVPAVAAGDGEPSEEAVYSACVGAATADAGFSDVAGGFAEDAVNCLAHYGITVGTAEGVFASNDSISRLQMALFLTRAAGPAGIVMDDPEDQDFTDIGGYTDEIQDAVNQAAALEIMAGTGEGMFSPAGLVTRQDMAVFLDGFLDASDVELDEDLEVDTPFTDVDSVPFAAYGAINRLYEFGVAKGTGDGTTFSPGALVTRGQMAVFVTRALAHTNARPAGLSVQAESLTGSEGEEINLSVAVRDSDNQPVPDVSVDLFEVSVELFTAGSVSDAFDSDGSCSSDLTSDDDGTCEIDSGDDTTDPDGNLEENTSVTLPTDAGSLTLWAWTGELGDTFDADETDSVSLMFTVTEPADALLVTGDMKENAKNLKFGDSVTFTFQVVDEYDDPVADEDREIVVTIVEEETVIVEEVTVTGNKREVTRTMSTDAAGRLELTYSQDDPDPDEDGNEVTLEIDIIDIAPRPGESLLAVVDDTALGIVAADTQVGAAVDDGDRLVSWTDADAVASTLTLDQSVKYHEASDEGSGVRNTVRATLVDQYGDPISEARVSFWSSMTPDTAAGGLGGTNADPADDRGTNRNGVATKSYNRDANTAGVETIKAAYVVGECINADPGCSETDGDITAVAIDHYWTNEATADVAAGAVVKVADTDNNTIVVQVGGAGSITAVHHISYRRYDHFAVYFPSGRKLVRIAEFEYELTVNDTLEAKISTDDDAVNIIALTNV